MQDPKVLLTILGKMAQKSEVTFDKLYQKLYNPKLWMLAYERIAPKPGNMTPGVDGSTIDGTGMERIQVMIADLKASRYKPQPVRRVYIPKPNGKQRPLGIPCFEDKLLQTVVKLILEAIYEPLFSPASHGFRPNRSCHTALEQVKSMRGTRWWVEGDIVGFFDTMDHDVLLKTLGKRITDPRFLHLIQQFLRAGYLEDRQYHDTYSGVPQGGNLSPTLSNIYLNELDQQMAAQIACFNRGKCRRETKTYRSLRHKIERLKKQARRSGDWSEYKRVRDQRLNTPRSNPQDPSFRRMTYVRYADDFLIGIAGSKADAQAVKQWLKEYLNRELKLELSEEKTHITNAKGRIQFLGYEIVKWKGDGRKRITTRHGGRAQVRVLTQRLALLMPKDRCQAFARTYGNPTGWKGERRSELFNLSELEILMIYNMEVRGFLGYYALADNRKGVGVHLLWMTTTSFMKTLAAKRRSSVKKVARSLKQGANQYVIGLDLPDGTTREYRLVSSVTQLQQQPVTNWTMDVKPNINMFRDYTELGQRIRANECEWCGTQDGQMEVHHVRKLKNLAGKPLWEQVMIARQRKTMVLCRKCHGDLHDGRLTEATRVKEKQESRVR